MVGGKRKVNSHTFCIDPKKKINTPKKQQTKADILQELKTVQKINEALEEEIKINIEKIKVLEEKVIFLEKQNNSFKNTASGEDVNEHWEPVFCYECEFPADDFRDLGEHMLEYHFQIIVKCVIKPLPQKKKWLIICLRTMK